MATSRPAAKVPGGGAIPERVRPRSKAGQLAALGLGALLLAILVLSVLAVVLEYIEPGSTRALTEAAENAQLLGGAGLLLIEEGGVPLPVPGDVIVMFSAHNARGQWGELAAVFGLLELSVLVGSGFLYAIASRYGRRLAEGRAGEVIHLTPDRLRRAERWIGRWGVWAVFFGRHVPGGRVAMTVVAATFGLPYRAFLLAVACSTAIWLVLFMTMGVVLGPHVADLARAHRTTSFLVPLGLIVLFSAYVGYRLVKVSWGREAGRRA